MTRTQYRRQALRLYRLLPDTPSRCHRGDCTIVDRLYQDDVPLSLLETALLVGTARRVLRDPGLPKLGTIRSIAYFLPILQQLHESPPPDGYLDYLRHTLQSALRQQEATSQPTKCGFT